LHRRGENVMNHDLLYEFQRNAELGGGGKGGSREIKIRRGKGETKMKKSDMMPNSGTKIVLFAEREWEGSLSPAYRGGR